MIESVILRLSAYITVAQNLLQVNESGKDKTKNTNPKPEKTGERCVCVLNSKFTQAPTQPSISHVFVCC